MEIITMEMFQEKAVTIGVGRKGLKVNWAWSGSLVEEGQEIEKNELTFELDILKSEKNTEY